MTADERADNQSIENGLTRRQFLVASAATAAGAVVFTGCQNVSHTEFQAESRVRVAEDVLTAFENWYATTCTQCGAGCGTIIRIIEGRAKKVEGNPDHPINLGKLCARGQASVQEQYHPDRIQGPLKLAGARGSGSYTPISWDDALGTLVGNLRNLQSRASDVSFISSPLNANQAQIADRFSRSYGAQWMTFDPVNEAPFREAARRVFGVDVLPEFDIQNARYILSFGSDFLGTWLSPVRYEMQYGVFRQGNYRAGQFQPRQGRPRGYLVQVEPHMSMTGANADQWVWVQPGMEGMLALSMAQVIVSERLGNASAASSFSGSLDSFAPDRVAQQTGVPAETIRSLARDFMSRGPSLALAGGPTGAQTNGTETIAAILTLNAVSGAVGRQGGVRLNPPSALEGLPQPTAPNRFADWQQFTERLRNRQVQGVLVYDANPVYGLPDSMKFRDALAAAPFIASFSSFMDETTVMADLILPSHVVLEDWGTDVPDPAPGYQVVSVQQPVVRPLYDTRSFWDVLLTVGDELGGAVQAALPWRSFQENIKESMQTLQSQRRGSVPGNDFETFWVNLLQRGGWWDVARSGSSASTPSSAGNAANVKAAVFSGDPQAYPYNLVLFEHNTLGAGESAHLPWLQATPDPVTTMAWETWVEVNPTRARELGLREGDIVSIESPTGKVEVPVYVHPAAPPTALAMPLGQGHTQFGRWASKNGGRRGVNPMDLVDPKLTDESTGALAYGATRVKLTKTGRRVDMPKFEGTANEVGRQFEEEKVLQYTRTT